MRFFIPKSQLKVTMLMSNQNILGSWISKLVNEILYSEVSTKGDYVNVQPKHVRVMN